MMKSSSFIRPRVNFVGSLHSTQSQSFLLPDTVESTTTATHRQKKKRKEGRWRAGKSATGKQLQHNFCYRLPTVNEFFFSIGVALPMHSTAVELTWLSRLSSIVRLRRGAERAVSFWCEKILFCSPQNVKGQREREREKGWQKSHKRQVGNALLFLPFIIIIILYRRLHDWLPACVCLLFFKNWPRQLFFFSSSSGGGGALFFGQFLLFIGK